MLLLPPLPSLSLARRVCIGIWIAVACRPLLAAPPADTTDFFEARIRPALIEHCYECHASDSEQAGGLSLDSRAGWEIGGDSGAAIVPGDAEASRLFRVIASIDAELEMPPDGKLPAEVIADFRRWIDAGAVDPRQESAPPAPRRDTIDWEVGRKHWAYQQVQQAAPPECEDVPGAGQWVRHPIDRFVLRRLSAHSLQPSPPAGRATLLRRLSFDLTGLPPSPQQLQQFVDAEDEPGAYERIVDQLIASPDFAERFARHWLDVTRYAESVTLRGLIFPQAWRFRDYVIQSINEDRSWRDVILEHLAGDLRAQAHAGDLSIEAQQRSQIAATFLCLGNSNLENQQKRELEMDFIDEQLDTIGRALLGQTFGCARCHDHKFDPIPTSDYYAMAGILHGSAGIDHANVSRWIENPLPLPAAEQQQYDQWAAELAQTNEELSAIKKRLQKNEPAKPVVISASSLSGVVVDDAQARRVGDWMQSSHTKPYVDAGYLHDQNSGRGEKSLTFQPEDLPAGQYEVRIAYCASGNRSTRVPVTVFSADGEETVLIDQCTPGTIDGVWDSLGRYRFEAGGQAFVMISNEGADGHVIGDAIHFLPIDNVAAQDGKQFAAEPATPSAEVQNLQQREKVLTANQSRLQKLLAAQPKAMGLRPRSEPTDLPIHIRGSIHNIGPLAPRGALQILAGEGESLSIATGSCGRLELAHWIAADDNPLTARVFVNRVWLWVMGQGLVRTPDNFGTTGQPPTHGELLDWLADRFVQEGWSLKRLVKHIVMSATYRQSADLPGRDDPRWAIDPDNRFWWRSDRKPLSAESIRDGVLLISGELDRQMFGSRIRPGTNADYGYEHDPHLRSIYMPMFRNSIPELLEAFNFADPSFVTGQRGRGIVAQQALLVLNHPWFAQRAAAAAQRDLERGDLPTSQRIELAFRRTLSRLPSRDEMKLAERYFDQAVKTFDGAADSATHHALSELYHGLFASAEFRQLD